LIGIRTLAVTASLLLAATAGAQQEGAQPPQAPTPAPPAAPAAQPPPSVDLGLRVELEPQALALLKAMSDKLAAAHTLSFVAIAMYESPARTGQPLAYLTRDEVTLQRPDKLRVITTGDGPRSEFYYDGKTMTAFSPGDDMAAVDDAPPTIDAMLKAVHDLSATYFPFADAIVANPYEDITDGLKLAFVVGKSHIVGGVETDIVALANESVQGQLWIGTADKLPRLFRATFFDEPGNFRHGVEFVDWRLDGPVAPGTFASAKAATAHRIKFAAPDAPPPEQPAKGGKTP